MSDNKNLHKAKSAKNDEFYTRYEDIEKEVTKYPKDLFKGKSIYCPCDDYRWSNFHRYFKENFEFLGLRCLTTTNYDIGNGAYLCIYDGNTETVTGLRGNGDFCSEECTEIMRQCDMVITNPPFSLFRRFVAQLVEYGKEFLIIGNMNAITYKEIFPLIKENKLWLGCSNAVDFEQPNKEIAHVLTRWFTNLTHSKRNQPLDLVKWYEKEPQNYPKYDNYNAIEVSKVCNIPADYQGVMGVPITFLDKYCPEQFEIIGATESEGKGFSMGLWLGGGVNQALVRGNKVYKRLFIKHKHPISYNND